MCAKSLEDELERGCLLTKMMACGCERMNSQYSDIATQRPHLVLYAQYKPIHLWFFLAFITIFKEYLPGVCEYEWR